MVVNTPVPCTPVIASGAIPFANTCDAALIVSLVLPLCEMNIQTSSPGCNLPRWRRKGGTDRMIF